MRVYYNENDPFAVLWLKELMAAGLIPTGHIDDRDIRRVRGSDVTGFEQCHFFAGIGGWPYALELAGWDNSPIWTGSCPCQPFSVAGKREGARDSRHLWPEFHRLIAECRPATVLGEQVASKDGRLWLAGIRTDLERLGYAVGAADLCIAGCGAPHIRQRLFWVAQHGSAGLAGRTQQPARQECTPVERSGDVVRLADADRGRFEQHHQTERRLSKLDENGRLGIPDSTGSQPRHEPTAPLGHGGAALAAGVDGHWASAIFIPCTDGKARRVEPGIQPLAHGISNRVGTLRGAGNTIGPHIAAEFIFAFLETQGNSMSEPHNEPGNGQTQAVTAPAPKRVRKRRSATPQDVETAAIGNVYLALAPLGEDHAAMERVIEYVRGRFGFSR